MSKYTTVTVSGVIIQVAETTKIKGYTKGVIESMLLTDKEMNGMTDRQINSWIRKNNKRMESICAFLNEHGY